MLILSKGLEHVVSTIAKTAINSRIGTFCRDRASVASGIAVGVVEKDGKPKIVINRSAAKGQGMDLPSALLRLADIL